MDKNRIFNIGRPGSIDPVFGLVAYRHPQLMEFLYCIVWKDSGNHVSGIGSFFDQISAENYVKYNRIALLDKEIENILLVNR